MSVARQLRDGPLAGLPLITGGRSSGAGVACRTAVDTGSVAVLCLAFPLHPPGRPEKTRLPELDAVTLPTLVVQGASDPFGLPPAAPNRVVHAVPGTHTLGDQAAVREVVVRWLTGPAGDGVLATDARIPFTRRTGRLPSSPPRP